MAVMVRSGNPQLSLTDRFLDDSVRSARRPKQMNRQSYSSGILIEEIEGGLLVQQRGEAYVARNWHLTPSVDQLIRTAIASGLDWMIRSDHPLRKARWPNGRGVVYLAFSASPICNGQSRSTHFALPVEISVTPSSMESTTHSSSRGASLLNLRDATRRQDIWSSQESS